MTRCASCDADDELLFTCSHCNGQFCAAHQFPHHACAKFTRRMADDGAATGTSAFEFGDDETEQGPGAVEASDGRSTDGETTGRSAAATADGTSVPGPRVAVARDAARETRPDRVGPAPDPPGRGMPWERGDASVTEWMREQTYPSYLLKVGGLSLLLTTSYYGGLAVTLFGYV